MKSTFITFLALFICTTTIAQEINVLFLGNSYTAFNNLPLVTNNLLIGTDRKINYREFTPGGYTLDMHSKNEMVINAFKEGQWDYVVLQDQSQLPSIDFYRYALMYPAVDRIKDSVEKYNPCAKIVMFTTWGRQYGGMQCENYGMGTYCSADFRDFNHMQDTLSVAYYESGIRANAFIAPVGQAWQKVLNETDIILHGGDESHPNMHGTYLAACVFHALFWNESPIGLPNNNEIPEEEALILQQAAHQVVFNDTSYWNINYIQVQAGFTFEAHNNTIHFINTSEGDVELSYEWDFGDGITSTEDNPIHIYEIPGLYAVRLTAKGCKTTNTSSRFINIVVSSLDEQDDYPLIIPNPAKDKIIISNDSFRSLEIFNHLGNMIYQEEMQQDNTTIDVSGYSKGIYFVKLYSSNDIIHIKKLIIE